METTRKPKVTPTLEADETVIQEQPTSPAEEAEMSVVEEIKVETPPETTQKPSLLTEAPAMFGLNPSAQEIEDFRTKELAWRAKLKP